MHYSIRYKDAKGLTSRSEYLPFETNGAAKSYASEGMLGSALVEVWKNDDLVVRLENDRKRPPN